MLPESTNVKDACHNAVEFIVQIETSDEINLHSLFHVVIRVVITLHC